LSFINIDRFIELSTCELFIEAITVVEGIISVWGS